VSSGGFVSVRMAVASGRTHVGGGGSMRYAPDAVLGADLGNARECGDWSAQLVRVKSAATTNARSHTMHAA